MNDPTHLIGIDLGTSNCAMAFVELAQGPQAPVTDFPVLQLLRPGETAARSLFPSCLYLPGDQEINPENIRLPWNESPSLIAGEYARWQGARVPGRMIASAKSWLCHGGVDRSAPILPWGAPSDIHKLSPIEASARLVNHMVRAWDHAHPEAPLAEQEVVLTVPASFDEVARSLTVGAARRAGLEKFTLLEEPQAAFYDFTARNRTRLTSALKNLRLVLVVDVGGGTSDFTLVQVGLSPEGPVLRRIAVGEHLMLGGDNMDAALAHRAEAQMKSGTRKLSALQWGQLVQSARSAKESLLSRGGKDEYHLAVASEGSRLLGGSLSARLQRSEAEEVVLEGFFPLCQPDETPRRAPRTGIQEMGLPYAQDPAVTRHIAAFLRQHAQGGWAALAEEPNTQSGQTPLPRPDAILLNGGVFNSARIAERLQQAVSAWWPSAPLIPLLEHESLELAVARGAAYYGLVRRGMGSRIGGGTAHAFYLGLATQAEDGSSMAVCLIPRGHEEGEPVELTNRPFQLTLGQPVQFPLYTTTADRIDSIGEIVRVGEDMNALPPIHTLLQGAQGKTEKRPVHVRATLTEIGTLELWCVSQDSGERWRLEFELRGAATESKFQVTESMPARFADARNQIERLYGRKPVKGAGAPGPKEIKQLWSQLEYVLGPRENWRLPVLRELWSTLFSGAPRRRRSEDHEKIFFQLAGYTLRPGFGYPLDEWRCDQMYTLFGELVHHHKVKPIWNEFWIFWRRIAGGLSPERQQEIWQYLEPYLARRIPPRPAKAPVKMKGIQPEGLDEMTRAAAALEHLSPQQKTEFGDWILDRIRQPGTPSGGPWTWSLGRLGARVPIYGSSHNTVPPDQVESWLTQLLELDIRQIDGAPFAAVQLARLTGDRTRDLSEEIRSQTDQALRNTRTPDSWRRLLHEVIELEATDKARALGDTLPVGLHLA